MNFEQDYLPKLGLRAAGFHEIFRLLRKRFHEKGPLVIVETGCVRDAQSWEGDGNSTVMFDAFARDTGSRFISIDVNPKHCALAKELCPQTDVLCGNSIPILYRLRERLELGGVLTTGILFGSRHVIHVVLERLGQVEKDR